MKKLLTTILLTILAVSTVRINAQVVDSVDVADYDLELDLSQGSPFAGKAVLTVELTRPLQTMSLRMIGTLDSLFVDGVRIDDADLSQIPVAGIAANTPFTVTVHYHGRNYVESYGFGGFHFDSDMSYNLGVAFNENPHVMGRAMFPCRDNFHDKATYTLRVKTRPGWTAECGGTKTSAMTDAEGCEHTVWRIPQPTPTYLVSVSQAAFRRINKTVAGYPLTLGFTTQDSAGVVQAFAELDSVVPMFERCFGPYRWDRIGYIATKKGSMEHVNNIALVRDFMASMSMRAQSTIAHELAHAWFGNLVTCRTEGDMWFNEGGASFASEVAREAVYNRAASNAYYQENLESVIRTSHITDNGYYALNGMPHSITYGSTTYDKGWMMWHYMRGYLGDSLFYASLRQLMADKAFGTINAAEACSLMSAYSGVDLTDFFRFHVYGKGFVDYHIEWLDGRLHISQQGVGTDSLMRSNRVPVTFMASDGRTEKRWYAFDGRDTTIVPAGLPFTPAYCLLDRDCEISDAAIRGEMTVTSDGQNALPYAHFRIKANGLTHPVQLYVDHHWGKAPGLDSVDGVLRVGNRYWTVAGNVDYASGIEGRFQFTRGNYSNADFQYLDYGFYNQSATMDSLALMHRYNSTEPWTCVSRHFTPNRNDGHFVCTLEHGEYALAVIDTNVVGITHAATVSAALFPNPLSKGEALTLETGMEGCFNVTIYDSARHELWHKKGVRNGRKIRPNLPAGTYLVVIENKFVSLHSKLIQL